MRGEEANHGLEDGQPLSAVLRRVSFSNQGDLIRVAAVACLSQEESDI